MKKDAEIQRIMDNLSVVYEPGSGVFEQVKKALRKLAVFELHLLNTMIFTIMEKGKL